MSAEDEDTTLPCKKKSLARFVRQKVNHQAKLGNEISHDDFLNILLDKNEAKGGK